MSVDQALALPNPEDTIDALADPLWQRVGGDWNQISPTEQVIFGVWSLKVEVCNGGFAQFFFNSVGEATPQIIDGLKQIGAQRAAEIIERALRVVGSDLPFSDWRARQARVEALPHFEREQLSLLDDEFYEVLPDTMQRARTFALAHRAEFRAATIR
jgi:uncharacterized protein DUF4375